MRRNIVRGFTLLELMIVVAVIAIIAAIAIPSYLSQVRKSRRSDAISTLGDLQLRQERYRAEHATYGTVVQVGEASSGTTFVSQNGYYTISLPSVTGNNCPDMSTTTAEDTGNSYWLRAVAVAGTTQANDTGCTTILLKNECGKITKTPSTCWSK